MIQVRAFRPCDVDTIEPQDRHLPALESVGEWRRMIRTAATSGPAWTAVQGGRVLGVAGLGQHWPGRSEAWCLLARDVPVMTWPAIHRVVLKVLASADIRRIEATTRAGFAQGERWMRMLGFVSEGRLAAYGPDGADHTKWARVQ